MNLIFNNNKYELIENYKEAFNIEELEAKFTDYFDSYDYVVGDYAYGKLRLKGFNEKNNPNYRKINDIKNKDNYIKKECAYECKYFVLKKITK